MRPALYQVVMEVQRKASFQPAPSKVKSCSSKTQLLLHCARYFFKGTGLINLCIIRLVLDSLDPSQNLSFFISDIYHV